MDQTTYRGIVSGQNRTIAAGLVRLVLRLGALVYGVVIRCRNWGYDTGLLRSTAVDIPVICIGNITTGGTGKTPLVIWLCNYLQEKGLRCAILTRGYKTEGSAVSDEPALLTDACQGTPVIIQSDRVAGARKAIDIHQPDVLIMDDGFQHRRLRRNLDILAIDATCPFGYGHILPAGLLREPMSGLKRAAAVVITRSNQVANEQLQSIEQAIRTVAGDIPIARSIHQQTGAVTTQNQPIDPDTLRNRKIAAFCGIGNPQAFFDSLSQNGLEVCQTCVFEDHHAYTPGDLQLILKKARAVNAEIVLCTQKDWSKCENLIPAETEVVFATMVMKLDFTAGFDTITRQLEPLVHAKGMNN